MLCDPVVCSAWAILALRLAVGTVFVAHGLPKLGARRAQTLAFFRALRLPAPGFAAALAGVVEFAGGLCLLAGLATPMSAGLLAALLVVAIAKVKWMQGFVGGSEFEFTLLAGCLALLLLGGGALSLDRLL